MSADLPTPLPGTDQPWTYPPGGDGTITRVHFVRHGEVDNPSGRLYGRQEGFHLSPRGEQHARNAAAALAGRDVTSVYASPLMRTQQTAYPIAQEFGLDIVTNAALIESGTELENELLTPKGIITSPHLWKYAFGFGGPAWGEHYTKMVERMLAAAHKAVRENRGHEAVCVSHQCSIWVLRLFAEDKPLKHNPARRMCSLGSITTLVFDGDIIVDVEYQEPSGQSNPASLQGGV